MSFLSLGGKHARASLRQKAAAAQKRSAADAGTAPPPPSLASVKSAPPPPTQAVQGTSTVVAETPPPSLWLRSAEHALLDSKDVPWCDSRRFEPVVLDDVLMNPPKVKEDVFRWMRARLFEPGTEARPVLFLRGPSGSCKSTTIRVAARACGVPCEEPPCFRLRDLMDGLAKNVCTRAFCLDRSRVVHKRVWLFTGLDGWMSGASGDTAAADVQAFYDLLSDLHAMGARCPPIVFTATSSDHPRMRQLRALAFVHKLFCNGLDAKRSRVAHEIGVAARRACVVAGVSTSFADVATSAFNGDMKHLMTTLELASRGLITATSSAALATKDEVLCLNVNDAFQACKFLLQPTCVLSADALSVLFEKFSLLPALLRENGTFGVQDSASGVSDLADLAEMWSSIDVCEATYWQHPALSDAMHLVAVKMLRDLRSHSHAGALEPSFMLRLPQKASPNREILQDACSALNRPVLQSPCSSALAAIEEFELWNGKAKNEHAVV